MKSNRINWLVLHLAIYFLISVNANFAVAEERNDAWLIVPGKTIGRITPKTSEADLIHIYGKSNVMSKIICIDEECTESEMGTILYPGDEIKSLEIQWKNIQKRQSPKRITIHGRRWKTAEGITIGTSLGELERLNGKPFLVSGLGVDYSGTITSWEKGRLERRFSKKYKVVIVLCEQRQESVSREEFDTVTGHIEIKSDNKVFKKLDLRVCGIYVFFD